MNATAPTTLLLAAAALSLQAGPAPKAMIKRGGYLMQVAGCHDCHTPLKMGPKGPEPDMTRMLSGHPEGLVMPPAPKLPEGPWLVNGAATLTAWSGPWGVTFAANLTPDKETGLSAENADEFIKRIRSGRHLGKGRPVLPPMPIQNVQAMTDEDLKAVYAYLRSIPAVKNRVPDHIPAQAAPQAASAK
ncbi:MAG TPA: c-type cytochrome [Holophagaceae bacterium]|nr:c-type cytochrome [Holophagaceae bacterium]